MGIAAVPGSGKTFILESLIAELIAERQVPPEKIGVFTFMRSARANLLRRVNGRLDKLGSLDRFSDAFTIHSLALKILRLFEGRGEEINLLEEYEQSRLIRQAINAWLRTNLDTWQALLPEELDPKKRRGQQETFRFKFADMCKSVIRTAKHYQYSPQFLQEQLRDPQRSFSGSKPATDQCLNWAVQVYQRYHIELQKRNCIDYDDLGWRALDLMGNNLDIKSQVQDWYDYVFEDEAQDSSPLQEMLLKTISERTGNLIRVGDPNQSITGTFTTADPFYFRQFCQQCQDPDLGHLSVTMDQSSRSAEPILELANGLVRWVCTDPKIPKPLNQAFVAQYIQPAPPANPPTAESQVACVQVAGDPGQELEQVVAWAVEAVKQRPHNTVAILVSRNEQGFQIVEKLQPQGIKVYDLLRSNPRQQQVIQQLGLVTDYLSQPADPRRLLNLTASLREKLELPQENWPQIQGWLMGIPVEAWLFPWPGSLPLTPPWPDEACLRALSRWRQLLVAWLTMLRFPGMDVLSAVIQDLYHEPDELQLAHFILDQLQMTLGSQADWHQITAELRQMETSALSGLPSESRPHQAEPGSITVATLHKSKGLEWDEVFVMGVSAYEYPMQADDHRLGLYFLERTDLTAEALAQLRSCTEGIRSPQPLDPSLAELGATTQAFIDLASERLRLLYVGITRACRRLTLTVSSQNRFGQPERPAKVFEKLQTLCAHLGGQDPL